MDGKDEYSWKFRTILKLFGWIGKITRMVDLNDQVDATRKIFESDKKWTVVRGSDLEEGRRDVRRSDHRLSSGLGVQVG